MKAALEIIAVLWREYIEAVDKGEHPDPEEALEKASVMAMVALAEGEK